jgi:hypothetical protein
MANLESWRNGQGAKIRANRPIEVYRSCDHQAQLWAAVRKPLILSADEITEAIKCAIAQERRRQHGPLSGLDADAWWGQVNAIANAWGIHINRTDWESTTKTATVQEAA